MCRYGGNILAAFWLHLFIPLLFFSCPCVLLVRFFLTQHLFPRDRTIFHPLFQSNTSNLLPNIMSMCRYGGNILVACWIHLFIPLRTLGCNIPYPLHNNIGSKSITDHHLIIHKEQRYHTMDAALNDESSTINDAMAQLEAEQGQRFLELCK